MKKFFFQIIWIIIIFVAFFVVLVTKDGFYSEDQDNQLTDTVKAEVERFFCEELQKDINQRLLSDYSINSSSISKYSNFYFVELRYTVELGNNQPTYNAEIKSTVWVKYNNKNNQYKFLRRKYELISEEIYTEKISMLDCTHVVSMSKEWAANLPLEVIVEKLFYDWIGEMSDENYPATFWVIDLESISIKDFELIDSEYGNDGKAWAVSAKATFKYTGYYNDGELIKRGGTAFGNDGIWFKEKNWNDSGKHAFILTELNDCYTFTTANRK